VLKRFRHSIRWQKTVNTKTKKEESNSMSENATVEQEAAPELAFEIKRGDKTVPIYLQTVKKGQTAGKAQYFSPNLAEVKLSDLPSIFPEEELMDNVIRPALNRFCLGISKEAVAKGGDDKQAVQDEFIKFFEQVSPRGETLSSLKERRDDMLKELIQLASDPTKRDQFVVCAQKVAKIEQDIQDKKAPEETAEPVKQAA
jgi:hypothetical protein